MEDLALEQQWFEKVISDCMSANTDNNVTAHRPTPQPAATPNPEGEGDEDDDEMPPREDSDDNGEPMVFRLEIDG